MDNYKTTAGVVGTLFIAGMVAGIAGNMIIQSLLQVPNYLALLSEHGVKLALGAMLLLITVAGDAAHGILMFPILKRHSEHMAIGYLGFRIINAVFLAVQVLLILLLIPISNEYLKAGSDGTALHSLATVSIFGNVYAYQIAMIFVGLSCMIFCYALHKTRLIPRFLAVWGLVGYATIFAGSILEVMGLNLNLIHTIPGGLWEVFIGVWLIVKGFNSNPVAMDIAKKV